MAYINGKSRVFSPFSLHKTERMLHIVPCIHLSSPEGVWTAEVLWNRVLAQEMHEFLMQTQSNFTFSAFKLNNISWTFCHMNKYVCLTLSHGCVSQLNPSPPVSLSHKNIPWWVLCEHVSLILVFFYSRCLEYDHWVNRIHTGSVLMNSIHLTSGSSLSHNFMQGWVSAVSLLPARPGHRQR